MSTISSAAIEPIGGRQQAADSNPVAVKSVWKGLFSVGAVVSLLMVLIIPAQLIVFSIAPPQSTAAEWFALYERNPLLGLLGFELLMVIYAILSILLALALAAALRQVSPSLTILYLALGLLGAVLFIVARPAFEMLSLSEGFAAAASDAERNLYLAAGEAQIATFHGTAFQVSYILGSLSGFILSFAMLRSKVFNRPTAYLRILSSVFDFGLFIPVIGLYVSIFSVLFLWIFHMLVAHKLFQLARSESGTAT